MSDKKSLEALDASESDLIELSTGVVLKGKPAAIVSVIAIMAAHPQPKPPIFKHPTMGVEMENYEDPDYVNRRSAWQAEQTDAVVTAFILSGTDLVSIPKDMFGPESPEFLDDFSLLGLPMRVDHKRWRYLTWVKHFACKTREDMTLIQEVVGRLSGVSKVDVRAAEDFPRS